MLRSSSAKGSGSGSTLAGQSNATNGSPATSPSFRASDAAWPAAAEGPEGLRGDRVAAGVANDQESPGLREPREPG
jgi:hypothetical protein